MQYTITTTKGTFTGTIEDICKWQAEMQGAYADIDGVDVDGIDFDADDMDATLAAVAEAMIDD